jgi:hypothetical protein
MGRHPNAAAGPFRASHIREGDPYELSNGHAIHCMTAGSRHGQAHKAGTQVLGTDPAVGGEVGIDVGISWNDDKNLRAPDLVVGGVKPVPGWQRTLPPLAVEYADNGQDEAELQLKISELLAGGTQYIWVVRLVGPLRVEVHTRDKPMRVYGPNDELAAPGVLKYPVPVLALVERGAADATTLRNLLDRYGYGSVEEIEQRKFEEGRADGEVQTLERNLLTVLERRGLVPSDEQVARIRGCRDAQVLNRWFVQAITAESVAAAID